MTKTFLEDYDFYNKENKIRYLKQFSDDTAKTYADIFNSLRFSEEDYDKDLYDFSLDELAEAIYSLNKPTIGSAQMVVSILTGYLSWAIEEGLTKSNINPLRIVGKDFYHSLIDHSKKLFISHEELLDLEDRLLINAQDKVIFRLIYEGVSGFQLSEILNLKESDIDGNVLTVHDAKTGTRKVKVSDRCIKIINEAIYQGNYGVYYLKNGHAESYRQQAQFLKSDYVVKRTESGCTREENLPASKGVVYNKITSLRKLLNAPYLTPKNIERSGMIKMAGDLLKRDGELTNKQLKEIMEQFNIQKIFVNNTWTYPYSQIRKFVNMENIEKYYNNQ